MRIKGPVEIDFLFIYYWCGNRLEKEIKKKKLKKEEKKKRFVKNYKNKNTQTNKLIISTMSKETNLKYEMVIKWVKSWAIQKSVQRN